MSTDCTFCRIINGQLPVSKIFEDECLIAFVDLFPVNKGHILIVPKKHAELMSGVDDVTLGKAMILARKLNDAIRNAFQCDGINLFLADGEAAGQEIFHSHLHIYPRFIGDGFGFRYDDRHFVQTDRVEMDRIASDIIAALNTPGN